MNKKWAVKGFVMMLMIAGAILLTGCGDKESFRVIQVSESYGTVTVQHPLENGPEDVYQGMHLYTEDSVKVGDYSYLTLLLDSDRYVMAQEGTTFKVTARGSAYSGRVHIQIVEGKALFDINEKLNGDSSFEVETPNAVISVRGTEFNVAYDPIANETVVEVTEGTVNVDYNDGQESMLIDAGYRYRFTDYTYIFEEYFGTSTGLDIFSGFSGADFSSISPIAYYGDKITNTREAIMQANHELVANLPSFVKSVPSLSYEEYYSYQYLYIDYDLDGNNEVILWLPYAGGCADMINVGIMHYDPNSSKLALYTVVSVDAYEYDLATYTAYDYTDNTLLLLMDQIYDYMDGSGDMDSLLDLFY